MKHIFRYEAQTRTCFEAVYAETNEIVRDYQIFLKKRAGEQRAQTQIQAEGVRNGMDNETVPTAFTETDQADRLRTLMTYYEQLMEETSQNINWLVDSLSF